MANNNNTMIKRSFTTQGFIDSASIHGAIAALSIGETDQISDWDYQSLLSATYLLLFDNIGIIHGPGYYAGASGPYSKVLSGLPFLEGFQFDKIKATRNTLFWLNRYPDALKVAWQSLKSDDQFKNWQTNAIELFWIYHAKMYGSLFNEEYIPNISKLLNCSEKELHGLHRASEDKKAVLNWLKETSVESEFARTVWTVSALIRGRFHEYLANSNNTHLISHPFRKFVERELGSSEEANINNSETYFTKIIIGSALLETNQDRRINTWLENINKARKAISLKSIALPHTSLDIDAESHAARAAKTCRLPASPSIIHRALDAASSIGLGLLITIKLKPWTRILSPIVQQTYKHEKGRSLGEGIASLIFDNEKRYKKLATDVPGRIKCRIIKKS
jgi:hypothetical protein